MRYFITGGLGVIGSHFTKTILDQGHSAIILDAAEEPRNVWMADHIRNKYGAKASIIMERMEKSSFPDIEVCDRIFHAAAHTGIPHSAIDPVDDWMSNAEATRLLLEKVRNCGKKIPIVALSSVKPYKVDNIPYEAAKTRYYWADRNKDFGISEKHLLEPDEPYAASKMAQSALCMSYARTYHMPVVVFRCSNLYGAAPSHGPRHGWLTWFCLSAVLGRPIEIQGTGFQVRDMLYSDDVNSAVFAAFENMEEEFDRSRSVMGNVYNIGGGRKNSISILEATNFIKTMFPYIEIKSGPGRKNEDQIFITDYSKFNSITKWEPKTDVHDGIKKIIYWAENNKEELIKMYDWCK